MRCSVSTIDQPRSVSQGRENMCGRNAGSLRRPRIGNGREIGAVGLEDDAGRPACRRSPPSPPPAALNVAMPETENHAPRAAIRRREVRARGKAVHQNAERSMRRMFLLEDFRHGLRRRPGCEPQAAGRSAAPLQCGRGRHVGLNVARAEVVVEIEAGLADTDNPRIVSQIHQGIGRKVANSPSLRGGGRRRCSQMSGASASRLTASKFDSRSQIVTIIPTPDASRPRDHRLAVLVVLRRVEVDVGVDQHGRPADQQNGSLTPPPASRDSAVNSTSARSRFTASACLGRSTNSPQTFARGSPTGARWRVHGHRSARRPRKRAKRSCPAAPLKTVGQGEQGRLVRAPGKLARPRSSASASRFERALPRQPPGASGSPPGHGEQSVLPPNRSRPPSLHHPRVARQFPAAGGSMRRRRQRERRVASRAARRMRHEQQHATHVGGSSSVLSTALAAFTLRSSAASTIATRQAERAGALGEELRQGAWPRPPVCPCGTLPSSGSRCRTRRSGLVRAK